MVTEGFLLKEGAGGVLRSYKKRWFVLKDDQLWYSKKQGDEVLGSIPVKDTNIADLPNQDHGFVISGPKLPRAYNLAALNANDKKAWIEAITKCRDSDGDAEEGIEFDQNGGQHATKKVGLKDFEILGDLGSGQFGKVKKVQLKGTNSLYAMKVMKKEDIVKNGMVESCKAEKAIMQNITHPYIVKLHYAFQTKDKLYLVMDLLPGGELFDHLSKEGKFSEERCRVFGAEVASALDHVHKNNIIYRDLKPENLVLDADGHVVLTDFGLAKQNMGENNKTYTFCGTPEYVAPEILKGTGHNKAVDWWSLGILLFEMLTGLPPFYNENVNEMYELILSAPLTFPDHVGPDARNLITELLNRDPAQRLSDGDKIKAHPFFGSIDWAKLHARQIKPK
jgi:serine/threonine protein kinase